MKIINQGDYSGIRFRYVPVCSEFTCGWVVVLVTYFRTTGFSAGLQSVDCCLAAIGVVGKGIMQYSHSTCFP